MAMTYGINFTRSKQKKMDPEKPAFTIPEAVAETIVKTKENMKGIENKLSDKAPECEQAVFNSAILEEDPIAYLMDYYKVTRDAAEKSLRHAQRMYPQDIWLVAQMSRNPVEWYANAFNVGRDAARNRLRSYRYKYSADNEDKEAEDTKIEPILEADSEPEEQLRIETATPPEESTDNTLSDIQKELDDIRKEKEELLNRVKVLEEQEKACVMVHARIKNRKTK